MNREAEQLQQTRVGCTGLLAVLGFFMNYHYIRGLLDDRWPDQQQSNKERACRVARRGVSLGVIMAAPALEAMASLSKSHPEWCGKSLPHLEGLEIHLPPNLESAISLSKPWDNPIYCDALRGLPEVRLQQQRYPQATLCACGQCKNASENVRKLCESIEEQRRDSCDGLANDKAEARRDGGVK